ncbi:MAG: hypothetical protein ACOX4M_06315 [Acetivibrionales bacterium]|jgi:hypothetical protein
MQFCPGCKAEYKEGIYKCSECGFVLVDEPEIGEDDIDSKSAFLMTAENSIEADVIEAILHAEGIPVLRKYKEAGDYMRIYMGRTIFGVDLFVPSPLLGRARQIIETSRDASSDDSFPDNIDINDDAE